MINKFVTATSAVFFCGCMVLSWHFLANRDQVEEKAPTHERNETASMEDSYSNVGVYGQSATNDEESPIQATLKPSNKVQRSQEHNPSYSLYNALNDLVHLLSQPNFQNLDEIDRHTDKLNEMLNANPLKAELLVDKVVELGEKSHASYYLASVVSNSDLPNRDSVLQNMLYGLIDSGTYENKKIMVSIAQMYAQQIDDPRVIKAIKSVALYEYDDYDAKREALQALRPEQLSNDEKSIVLNDLEILLGAASAKEKQALVDTIVAYSDEESATLRAIDFLSPNHDLDIRTASLIAINNGAVKPSLNLRRSLMEIASNHSDRLFVDAQVTLANMFPDREEE